MTRAIRLAAAAGALSLAVGAASPAGAVSKREAAARSYRAAAQLREDLKHVPKLELGLHQYELVISQFEKVRSNDPTSGYCDDALLAMAELYQAMSVRFEQQGYRQKAIETYELAAREYPHSKHRDRALAAAARLGGGAAPSAPAPSGSPVPAVQQGKPLTLALSDLHDPGEIVQLPGHAADGSASLIPVSRVRHHSYDDGTRIVLETGGVAPLKYDLLKRPERLYIDLYGTRLADPLVKGVRLAVDDTLLSAARLAQNRRNKARLVLDLRRAVAFDAFWLANPTRFVLDIRGAGTPRRQRTLQALHPASTAPPAPRAADTTAGGKYSLTRALGLKLDRILVDAGHGGHDTGSVGRGGLQEKDVVLDVAKRLGKLLEERLGSEVIYTRESDVFVPLEERTRIANEQRADLMISIHCNAAPTSKVRGIETYYLSLTSDSWELSVASMENAASSKSIHDLEDLVSKIAFDEKIEESKEFAAHVQARLHAGVSKHSSSIRDRGIRKAPFIVLVGAQMPAVLAEIGFISNQSDEGLMRKPEFRQEVAEHLFAGVSEYASSLGATALRTSLAPGAPERD